MTITTKAKECLRVLQAEIDQARTHLGEVLNASPGDRQKALAAWAEAYGPVLLDEVVGRLQQMENTLQRIETAQRSSSRTRSRLERPGRRKGRTS